MDYTTRPPIVNGRYQLPVVEPIHRSWPKDYQPTLEEKHHKELYYWCQAYKGSIDITDHEELLDRWGDYPVLPAQTGTVPVQPGDKVDISVAGIPMDGFKIDGEYYLTQTDLGKAVGKDRKSAFRFFQSSDLEALPFKGLSALHHRYGKYKTLVKLIPVVAAVAYWQNQARKNNIQAIALVNAIASETIERRIDSALGQTKTEQEYENRTAIRREVLEAAITAAKAYYEFEHTSDNLLEMLDEAQTALAAKKAALRELNTDEREAYQAWAVDREMRRNIGYEIEAFGTLIDPETRAFAEANGIAY